MWSSKMAARWRGKDGDLNADRSNFLACNNPNELVLSRADVDDTEMDTQSCADHSILSLFEDSGVSSEGKGEVEEESETLLSALTEMLDRVGDDDGTLSPFDIVPDTKLLTLPDCSDSSVTISLAKTKKAEKEVEVFTSTSLVNLVKLMHPYCLKVHVEEDRDKLREKETLFSQEEVWRYERPSEESDEEINVVSDDEEPVKKTKRTEVKREDLKPLKSVLLNGNSPRVSPSKEKKRVSFGPIQVAPFDESLEKELNEKNVTSEAAMDPLNSTKALGNPALEPQRISSSEKSSDDADAPPLKGETKAKSLSLQQYRQLRQKRQPLVEKQGNYITKWPSVSEPPKELPPILCLQGQSQNSCGPKTVQNHPDGPRVTDPLPKPGHRTSSHRVSPSLRPSEAKPSTHQHISRLKWPRPESKTISPASLLPDTTTNPKMNVPESKKSPIKKSTLVSSDPPNPVLVPLPVSQTSSPVSVQSPSETLSVNSNPQSPTHLQTTESTSSAVFLQRQTSSSLSSEEKPQVLSVSQDATSLLQEIKNKFTETPSDISSGSPTPFPASTQTVSASESNNLEPKSPRPLSPDPLPQTTCPTSTSHPTQPLSTTDARTPANKEVLPELPFSISTPKEQPPTSQDDCATSNSGIEAADLTSLLEQFEETQAKEERACENEPGLITATPSSNLQTHGHMQLDRNQPPTSPLSLTSAEPLKSPRKTLRNPPQFKTPERVDIPEPLGTEVVLSTATRRKNPPSKAIQIIDPRPLPSKKTLISTSEPSAAHICPHTYSSICSDHDYCGSVDHSLTSATQRNRPKPSSLKDMYKITNESQVTALDSSAAVERKMQTSTGQRKSASQQHSEPTRTRLETNPSTDKALRFLDFSTASADGGVSKATTAPCTLPTPPPSPPARGREKRRYRRRSPRSSDSSSSSCCSSSSSSSCSSGSRSPKRQKLHHKRSESSSCSSSPCRSISHSPPRRYRLTYSRSRYSRSRSRSWSQSRSPSRSRSPSPRICHRQWRDVCSSRESRKLRREHEIRIQKLKAIDERRVVYVGRIRRTMTHDELRERFSQFGEVECVSLHFRDRGDHYGFVTFYNMEDAFAAIDNGGKLRKPDELPFDICFGGRRQFCNSNYADLDANRDAERSPPRNKFEDLDFDSLLKQAQRGLKR